MELVTVFWSLMTTGTGELVTQTAWESRLVVDCRPNPTALVDHCVAVRVGSVRRAVDGQTVLLKAGVGDLRHWGFVFIRPKVHRAARDARVAVQVGTSGCGPNPIIRQYRE